jgi:cysteine desulfuration protein SufE
MGKIKERINEIAEDFELFDDELEKYEYIVDVGRSLKPLDESEKIDKFLIEGCTSNVWLICEKKDGKLYFKTDSNTVIVKGLAAILVKIFSNLSAKEISEADLSLLDNLGFSEIITPTRQNGLKSMINKIAKYAQEENK